MGLPTLPMLLWGCLLAACSLGNAVRQINWPAYLFDEAEGTCAECGKQNVYAEGWVYCEKELRCPNDHYVGMCTNLVYVELTKCPKGTADGPHRYAPLVSSCGRFGHDEPPCPRCA